MKPSLTLILFCLMLFLISCESSPKKNTEKISLNLELQTSNKNKEIILENMLGQDINFSIDFNIKDSYKLNNNILNSSLKYFCYSFVQEQDAYLESLIFSSSKIKNRKTLVIYSEEFKKKALDLKNKYPNQLYFYLNKKNYEKEIIEILGVENSINRFSNINSLDKNLKIEHRPRVRNDISEIYFLLDYNLGKAVVPIIRNYALKIDAFSSSEIFHKADNIKKLVDFENLYVPLSNRIIEEMQKNLNIKNIENEFEKLLIEDYLLVEKIYQNNLFKRKVSLKTSTEDVQKNKCIKRKLSILRISSNEFSSLP